MKLSNDNSKYILERPFGFNYKDASNLANHFVKHLEEKNIYRMDHYLGKEAVQKIMTLRFSNTILSHSWNNKAIESVMITCSESALIEESENLEFKLYFTKYGIIRDMIMTHLLQLLTLITMNVPNSRHNEDIRDKKLEILQRTK